MSADKNYKLYAYRIEPDKSSTNESDFTSNLISHLSTYTNSSGERIFSLDQEKTEKDILSYYEIVDKNVVFGIMMRIALSTDVAAIPDSLLKKKTFTPEDLETPGEDEPKYRCKNVYYFISDATHIVVTLPPSRIKQFQVYSNRLLEVLRGNKEYIFNVLLAIPNPSLKDIKSITFGGNYSSALASIDNTSRCNVYNIGMDIVKSFLGNSIDTQALVDEDLLDANLIVKFKKKKKMDDEEVKKALSSVVSNLSENSSVKIETRKGPNINAGELPMCKSISLSISRSGRHFYRDLSLEMWRYLNEIKHILR